MDSAVIFDVDGVLLDLTAAEEDAFFLAFERLHGISGLSRDWDSYSVRNDERIIAEILARHGLPAHESEAIAAEYLAILSKGFTSGSLNAVEVPGARELLRALSGLRCGIATANLLPAAQLRLQSLNMWGGRLITCLRRGRIRPQARDRSPRDRRHWSAEAPHRLHWRQSERRRGGTIERRALHRLFAGHRAASETEGGGRTPPFGGARPHAGDHSRVAWRKEPGLSGEIRRAPCRSVTSSA